MTDPHVSASPMGRARRGARLLLAGGLVLGVLGTAVGAGAAVGTQVAGAAPAPAAAHARGHVARPLRAAPSHQAPAVHASAAPQVHRQAVLPHVAGGQTLTVNTTTDAVKAATATAADCAPGNATTCSLRVALALADQAPATVADTVSVPPGMYILNPATGFGTLTITHQMTVQGPASGVQAVVSGQTKVGVLAVTRPVGVSAPPVVQLVNVALESGRVATGDGGLLFNREGQVDLVGVTLAGGHARDGGGIFNTYGTVWMDAGTSISRSTAEEGGGIDNAYGAVYVAGSTFTGDTASQEGGAVYQDGGWISTGATFTGNSAQWGGAIYNDYTMTDSGSTYRNNALSATTGPYGSGAVLDNIFTATVSGATVTGTTAAAALTTVEGGVFHGGDVLTLTNVSVATTHMHLANGALFGGVLYVRTTARVTGFTVTGTSDHADFVEGGAVDVSGMATMDHVAVSRTSTVVSSGEEGGAIAATDELSQSNTTISGTTNVVTLNGATVHKPTPTTPTTGLFGGAEADHATGSVASTTITGTTDRVATTAVLGGAFAEGSPADLSTLHISGTALSSAGGYVEGGALYTSSRITMHNSSVNGTTLDDVGAGKPAAPIDGGAWYNGDEVAATGIQVLDTTVTTNGALWGGAFDNCGDLTTLTASTLAGTTVTVQAGGSAEGGLVYICDLTTLVNDTVADSTVTVPAAATAALVYFSTKLSVVNTTVTGDTVRSTDGSPLTGVHGGFVMAGTTPGSETVSFLNSIVAVTPATTACSTGTTGLTVPEVFISAGGNIDSGTSCGFTRPSDLQGTNPMVATVAANGGPVETAALLPGSPAVGHGVAQGCPATDARGVPRPAGHCDAGAFQTSGQGYWQVGSDGGIFAFGTAGFYGSMGGIPLAAPVVGMAATADQQGYWEVASDGGIFAFGNAQFYGSMGGIALRAPVVGMAATPSGHGYWEVASDGGIFAFGDAQFYGSMGGQPLNAPVVAIAAAPTGQGYWEIARDGGVFAYGTATFQGSMGGQHLNAPIVGGAGFARL